MAHDRSSAANGRPADDPRSWHEVLERHGGFIERCCRLCGLQHADADDVRQAVWLDLLVYLRRSRYDPARGPFRAYLRRVVRSAVARHCRRRAVVVPIHDGDEAECPSACGDELADREWVLHHCRLALRSLRSSVAPRSLDVYAALLQGASIADVARARGLTPPAIYKIRQRIRDRLDEALASQIRSEECA